MKVRDLRREDEYIVVSKSFIGGYDRKVLTRLYQPIIGCFAFSLYLTLLSELEFDRTISNESRPHSSLIKLMNISLDDFVLAIGKLEGIGLVKTKLNKKNGVYNYNIFAPLSPLQFFDNPLLDSKYHKILGDAEYYRNKMYFTNPVMNDDDFEDVSESFNDVYDFDMNGEFVGANNQVAKQNGKLNIDFNFDAFFSKLAELQISKSVITNEVKELLPSLAASKNVPAVDMANLIHKSLGNNGKVNIEKLKTLCVSSSYFDTSVSKPIDVGNENVNKVLNNYVNLNPFDFLRMKNNGTPVAESDRRIIENLIKSYNLPQQVCNVIIDYTLKNCEDRLVKNYVDSIASTLARKKITEAMEAIRVLENKPTRPTSSYVKQQVIIEEPVVEEVEFEEEDDDVDFEELQRQILAMRKVREGNE